MATDNDDRGGMFTRIKTANIMGPPEIRMVKNTGQIQEKVDKLDTYWR